MRLPILFTAPDSDDDSRCMKVEKSNRLSEVAYYLEHTVPALVLYNSKPGPRGSCYLHSRWRDHFSPQCRIAGLKPEQFTGRRITTMEALQYPGSRCRQCTFAECLWYEPAHKKEIVGKVQSQIFCPRKSHSRSKHVVFCRESHRNTAETNSGNGGPSHRESWEFASTRVFRALYRM